MPKLYQKPGGTFYTKKMINGQIVTQQIMFEGVDWLRSAGYSDGDEIGDEYWELMDNGWLFTKGEVEGGGEVDLQAFPDNEPATIVQDTFLDTGNQQSVDQQHQYGHSSALQQWAPRFLYDDAQSVYYTLLYVANSDPGVMALRVLIKNRGAVELLRSGVKIGDEFTELGLRMLFAKRWVYRND